MSKGIGDHCELLTGQRNALNFHNRKLYIQYIVRELPWRIISELPISVGYMQIWL